MRKIISILSMLFACAAPCAGFDLNHDVASGPDMLDDALHFGAGFLIAAGVGQVAPCDGWCRALLQLAVPLAVGLAKEAVFDQSINYQDVAGYGAGAAVFITLEFSLE